MKNYDENNSPQSISFMRGKYQIYKKLNLIVRIVFIFIMLSFLIPFLNNQNPNIMTKLDSIQPFLLAIFLIAIIYLRYKTAKLKNQLNNHNSTLNHIPGHPVKEITIKKLKFLQNDKQRLQNQISVHPDKEIIFKHSNDPKYCHVCGKKLEPGATYCKSCWTDVPKQ